MTIRGIIQIGLCFTCFLLFLPQADAQRDSLERDTIAIRATAGPFEDSIVIRWAPANRFSWEIANNQGYELVRVNTRKDGKLLTKEERRKTLAILATHLKPLPKDQWKDLVDKDQMAFLAAGFLYGEMDYGPKASSPTDLSALYEEKQLAQKKYGYSMFAADQSIRTAKALGLAFVDHEVKKGDGYLYAVRLSGPIDTSWIYLPGQALVLDNVRQKLPKPSELKASIGDQVVRLYWDEAITRQHYTSFEVEKSDDNGQTFTKINSAPIVNMRSNRDDRFITFVDSLSANDTPFVYRVRGRTIFGGYGPVSDTVLVVGRKPALKANLQIVNVVEYPQGQWQIYWEFDSPQEEQILGFQLYRSENRTEGFQLINKELISPTDRVFYDEDPLPMAYYEIRGIDLNGNRLKSFPVLAQLKDFTPPNAPTGLHAHLEAESGLVHLTWDANDEHDLQGYRVFFSNQKAGNFSQVTKYVTRDTFFTYPITMNTATEEIHFQVIAVDFRENFSQPSATYTLSRPDQTPPSRPSIKLVNGLPGAIQINWAISSSPDVASYEMQRKARYGQSWQTIWKGIPSSPVFEYQDSLVMSDKYYFYRILARDDEGLTSYSTAVLAKSIDNGHRASFGAFSVKTDTSKQVVRLDWAYGTSNLVKYFVLYRAEEGKELLTYKRLQPEEAKGGEFHHEGKSFSFIDQEIQPGQSYTYQLIAKFHGKGSSPFSKKIEVQIPSD